MILWRRLHPLATILNHLHPAYGQPSAAAAEFQKWPSCTQRDWPGCLYLVARQTHLKATDFQASKQIQTAARRFARIFQTAPDFFWVSCAILFRNQRQHLPLKHFEILVTFLFSWIWFFWNPTFQICYTGLNAQQISSHLSSLKALWWRDRQHVAQAPAPCLGHSGCIAVPIPRLKAIQILKGLS